MKFIKKILLENKIIELKPKYSPSNLNNHFFQPKEPLRANRFIVELEDDSNRPCLDECNIMSLNFSSNSNGESLIIIEVFIDVVNKDWLKYYLKSNFCKIFLLNAVADVLHYFEYEIEYYKHEYELNYNTSDDLIPKIYYKIID